MVEYSEFKINQKDCFKVTLEGIFYGLIYEASPKNWRVTLDSKGEFWGLDEFESRELAVDFLLKKVNELNAYRLNLLKSGTLN